MKALILVGGLGIRLREVVADCPKPMADARGKPFLGYLVEQLRDQGFDDLVLCVGYLAEQVRDHFGDGHRCGVSIDYSVETALLGTAGAIKNAQHLIAGPFLVANGDSYLEADFRSMVASHRRHRSADGRAVATIAAVRVDDVAAYGSLEVDKAGRVMCFGEKATGGAGWINGGVYVLEPAILDLIPGGRAVSIERETFPLALQSGWHLYSFPVEGFFVDIGTPEGYRRFQRYVKEKGL